MSSFSLDETELNEQMGAVSLVSSENIDNDKEKIEDGYDIVDFEDEYENDNDDFPMCHFCILLYSSQTMSRKVRATQEKVRMWLDMHKIKYQEIDGADKEQVNIRKELWKISSKELVYPQVFTVDPLKEETTFVGDYDMLAELIENKGNTLGRMTFEKKFELCQKVDDDEDD